MKPKNTGVGSLSVLQQIFLTQESNWCILHFRQILYQLSYQGRPHTFLESLAFSMVDHAFLLKTIYSLDLDAAFSWVCLSPLTVPTQLPLLNPVLLLLLLWSMGSLRVGHD